MRFVIPVLIAGMCAVSGCAGKSASDAVQAAIAGNLCFVMPALMDDFRKNHPHITINFMASSSGKHATQIINGAPFDIFLSADMAYPESLWKKGLTAGKPVEYARGMLVFFTTGTIDPGRGIGIVNDKSIKRIAVASPGLAPYGRAAVQALKNAGHTVDKKKFITAQNVMTAVNYIIHAADFGFVAMSAMYSPEMKQYKRGRNWMKVKPSLYEPIRQGIVLLSRGRGKRNAEIFYEYILSPRAGKIFRRYGYH